MFTRHRGVSFLRGSAEETVFNINNFLIFRRFRRTFVSNNLRNSFSSSYPQVLLEGGTLNTILYILICIAGIAVGYALGEVYPEEADGRVSDDRQEDTGRRQEGSRCREEGGLDSGKGHVIQARNELEQEVQEQEERVPEHGKAPVPEGVEPRQEDGDARQKGRRICRRERNR